jgi:phosphocarrier protein
MLEQDIIISNKLGLHARASAKLVQLVSGYRSTVMLGCRGREINAKSIMGVMLLAAGIGTPVSCGSRADELRRWPPSDLFQPKFDEGE